MRYSALRRSVSACAIVVALVMAGPGLAEGGGGGGGGTGATTSVSDQVNALNSQAGIVTRTNSGVDLSNGAFTFKRTDVSIGSGGFPQKLTVERTYNSKSTGLSGFGGRFSSNYDITYSAPYMSFGFRTLVIGNQSHYMEMRSGDSATASSYHLFEPLGGWNTNINGNQVYTPSLGYDYLVDSISSTGPDGSVMSYYVNINSNAWTSARNTCGPNDNSQLCFSIATWEWPTGEKIYFKYEYVHQKYRLVQVSNNLGRVLRYYYTSDPLNYITEIKAFSVNSGTCAVGRGGVVNASELCQPTSVVRTVTYDFHNALYEFNNTTATLFGVTNPAGEKESYGYTETPTPSGYISTIKAVYSPTNQLLVKNYYTEFLGATTNKYNYLQVTRQDLYNGGSKYFNFTNPTAPGWPPNASAYTEATGGIIRSNFNTVTGSSALNGFANTVNTYTDANNSTFKYGYVDVTTGPNGVSYGNPFLQLVSRIEQPEGNYTTVNYDARGNAVQLTASPKPNSGLQDRVQTATYMEGNTTLAGTCANAVTCNKVSYEIDPRGYRKSFNWDPVHGVLLSEKAGLNADGTCPDTNGCPQTDYQYTEYTALDGRKLYLLTGIIAKVNLTQSTTTRLTYDAAGGFVLKSRLEDEGGVNALTCYTYNSFGELMSESRMPANTGC